MIEEKNNILTVRAAAKLTGIPEMTLREGLKDPQCPWYDIGWAYRKPGSKNYMYRIYKNKLDKFVGIAEQEN